MSIKFFLNRIRNNVFLVNSMSYIFASVFIKGIAFITTPIFTRLMDASSYGIVSNFTTWGQFLATFLCLQLSSGIVSANINIAKERLDSYMGNIIRIAVLIAIIMFIPIIIFRTQIFSFIALEDRKSVV